jgi:Tol biopolymer transport system component
MSPDRWRRIEAIFEVARTRPERDRDAYVREACAGDESLRCEIMSLLEQPSAAFLDGAAGGLATSDSADTSLVGRRVGVYEITGVLGAGGMGRVYRAHDHRLGRDVAIKVLSHMFTDRESVLRFEREARTLASMNHPRVGAIYGLEDIEGVPALVLELIDGRTLASRLASGPLPLDEVLRYGVQIIDALAEAHAAGIVHRDLKPANVMLTRNGAKVVDFGLATPVSSAGSSMQSSAVFGTPAYLAPEQLEGREVGPKGDLFAFGMLLYEMATGQRPLIGAPLAMQMRHGDVAIRPPSHVRADAPPALDELIARLLQRNPDHRPPSAAVVRDQLKALSTVRPSRRKFIAVAGAGGVLAIASAAWRMRTSVRSGGFRPAGVSSVALLPGDKQDPALSPDGSTIAFSWAGPNGDRAGIYTMEVSGGDPHRLSESPVSDVSPAWSPDGQRIAFMRLRPGGASELIVVPKDGGSERKLSDVRMTELLRRTRRPLLGWSADGGGVIVPINDAETDRISLFRVGLDGHHRARLVAASDGFGPTQPAVSRNGRWMAYVSGNPRRLGVQAIDADGLPRGEFEYAGDRIGPQSPSLSPDGTELLFISGYEILQWNARTKAVHVVYVSPHPIQAMSVSWPTVGDPRVVFSSEPDPPEIRASTLADAGRMLVDARGSVLHVGAAPSFSPDGRWIVFDGGPYLTSGFSETWLADSRGERARRLTPPGFGRPSWSRDGRRIAFFGGEPSHVYVLDLDPEHEVARPQGALPATSPRQVTHAPFVLLSPDWSADDRYLYLTRPGPYRVMRVRAEGGDVEDLFEGGFKRLDPTGRRIYYGKTDQFGIFVRSLDGDVQSNPEERLVSDYVPPRGFDVSERGIYYVARDATRKPVAVRFFDFATKSLTDLAPPPRGVIPTITVSPDGERLLFDTRPNAPASLTLMELTGA